MKTYWVLSHKELSSSWACCTNEKKICESADDEQDSNMLNENDMYKDTSEDIYDGIVETAVNMYAISRADDKNSSTMSRADDKYDSTMSSADGKYGSTIWSTDDKNGSTIWSADDRYGSTTLDTQRDDTEDEINGNSAIDTENDETMIEDIAKDMETNDIIT